ncbi:MAG: glycosyltransferase N-terminal domain-containing protein [Eudoraea sp.]|uniref:3-deoxy-D-manno-octulosonic acid transferase n=1 Tax=Eudoraea sp. TaxID=1979955 RepID=UPI003C72B7A5
MGGRKNLFAHLQENINPKDQIIWMHAASLGEYEQGLPVLELLKKEYPSYKFLISFFSPSGYEVKKTSHEADYISYLPLDTHKNVNEYLAIVNPVLAIFIKYEIWPNMLKGLSERNIPSLLISSIFNEKQSYFKWYGAFMRKALFSFEHIFVQDIKSQSLLNSIGYHKVDIGGDTRLDRVFKILSQNNHLEFIENFKKASFCFVMGSTWAEDEEILTPYINATEGNMKYIIAPHKINASHLVSLQKTITKKSMLLSEYIDHGTSDIEVLIIDNIGLLTKIYSYADMAYVGGGFATGLHNTLEPAAYGIPVIIGPKYHGFKEAEELVELNGLLPITTLQEFTEKADILYHNDSYRKKVGAINKAYVTNNKGASIQIVEHIRRLL